MGAASIVITRRLYKISKISSVVVTPAQVHMRFNVMLDQRLTHSLVSSRWQRRKDLIIDLSIGLGIPAVGMVFRALFGRCRLLSRRAHSPFSLAPL